MNKKNAAAMATAILGILLVGLAAASLISSLGKITGTATVNAPTFFPRQISFGDGGQTYYKMGDYNFTANDTNKTVGFTGGNGVWFVSYPLNITGLAKAEYNMSIEARSDNESGQIDAQLLVIKNATDNYNTAQQLCSATVGNVSSRQIYNLSCTGDQVTNMDPSWRLALELYDGLNSVNYYVYLNGNTKVEMIVK